MNVRKVALEIGAVAFALLFALMPVVALAQVPGQGFGANSVSFNGTANSNNLPAAIVRIVNTLLVIAGIIVVIFIIIGGVQYVTSAGDEDKAAQAKNTVMYAVIGAVVIILATVIVRFIIEYSDLGNIS